MAHEAAPLPPSCRLTADARAHYEAAMAHAAALDVLRAPLQPHIAGWALSGRTFGVELEGYLAGGGELDRQQNRVRLALHHAGLEVWTDTRTRPAQLPAWDVGQDITVYDPTRRHSCGIEVRTPILRGEAGLDELRAALDALASVGFLGNDSCALHVHIGVPDPTLAELRAFSHTTLAQEDALDQLVIPARRGNHRRHALRLGARETSAEGRPDGEASLLHTAIDRAPNDDILERLVNPARKFHKFTTSHLVTLGTIENRMRDGYYTTSQQVLDWVRFTDRVVDTALRGEIILPSAETMHSMSTDSPLTMRPTAPLFGDPTRPYDLAAEREAARADYVTWAIGRPRDLPAAFLIETEQAYAARVDARAPQPAVGDGRDDLVLAAPPIRVAEADAPRPGMPPTAVVRELALA